MTATNVLQCSLDFRTFGSQVVGFPLLLECKRTTFGEPYANRPMSKASEGPIDIMNSPVSNQSLVVSDREILSGEPVCRGTRIAIDTVLASLDAGIDMARI